MSFEKTEFGTKNDFPVKLIEIIQQESASVVDHIENIKVRRIARQFHYVFLCCFQSRIYLSGNDVVHFPER